MWQQWRAPVVKWYRPISERSRLRLQVTTIVHNAASFVHTVGTDRGRTQLNLLLTSLFFSFLFQTKSCDFPFSILSFYSGSLSLSLSFRLFVIFCYLLIFFPVVIDLTSEFGMLLNLRVFRDQPQMRFRHTSINFVREYWIVNQSIVQKTPTNGGRHRRVSQVSLT